MELNVLMKLKIFIILLGDITFPDDTGHWGINNSKTDRRIKIQNHSDSLWQNSDIYSGYK